ncbi:MAG: aminotransferase class I/II-fold pyridoxal phosphate-dependent enzyme [Myxococcales bacterium]|nr:MAG: aminotransferase class I/II-fold pyridoxal phosphate-dependent enzyme [Myxococcales bacterium]
MPDRSPVASPYLKKLAAYAVEKAKAPTDLKLDANEGPRRPELARLMAGEAFAELPHRYVKPTALEAALAARLSVSPAQLLVTCGADDAIDRVCRAYLPVERELLVARPTFEMIPAFARMSGGRVRTAPWLEGPYPVEALLAAIGERTGVVAVVSPNNPTGLVASDDDLRRLSAAAPHAVVMVDEAYGPFADRPLTQAALALPNAVAVHTFSKAYSMAGLRVGYVAGPEAIIRVLRAVGGPYPVSSITLALAERWLQEGESLVAGYIAKLREERRELERLLTRLGARPLPSQANFVFAYVKDPVWIRDALAGLGVAVRAIAAEDDFPGGLRVTLPGDAADFARLTRAVQAAFAPQALLFDMDGVLADVSRSYRAAIIETVRAFGANVTAEDVAHAKAEPDSNNDWIVTQRLLARHGKKAPLDAVTECFERLYQGAPGKPGLRERETLIPPLALLERLAARCPLGVVTGRPRGDAERFLDKFKLNGLFKAVVCLEDGPKKPDPAPVKLALERLGATAAWLIGDAPDDMKSARAAGVAPLGVVAPEDRKDALAAALHAAGASRILDDLSQVEDLLP